MVCDSREYAETCGPVRAVCEQSLTLKVEHSIPFTDEAESSTSLMISGVRSMQPGRARLSQGVQGSNGDIIGVLSSRR